MYLIEDHYYTINKPILRALGIWPYDQSHTVILQRVLIILILGSHIFVQVYNTMNTHWQDKKVQKPWDFFHMYYVRVRLVTLRMFFQSIREGNIDEYIIELVLSRFQVANIIFFFYFSCQCLLQKNTVWHSSYDSQSLRFLLSQWSFNIAFL